MNTPATVTVRAERDYQVLIGSGTTAALPEQLPAGVRVFLMYPHTLTDAVGPVAQTLTEAGHQVLQHAVPDGEAAKTHAVAAECWAALGQAGFTRDDVVVGVGGGATTDLAGFVAATWLRGVAVLQVPTTLLGMVDAAVGGKTGINIPQGKNLVGAFHSPRAVLCDPDWLRTLPHEDLRAGLAEVIKCGFIADPHILDLIESNPGAALDPEAPVLAELVHRSVSVKAEVVSGDLREAGNREILNYGHTFAHAVEQVEGFRWRHGDAVSVGLVYVAELARRAGLLSEEVAHRHRSILTAVGLPVQYPPGRWAQLREVMGRDKKARGTHLRFVVLTGLAHTTRLTDPDPDLLTEAYAAISTEER